MNTGLKTRIDEIISIEWKMFQNVSNMGGRASCQDDFETFYIMRFSQYGSWTEKMIDVYYGFVNKCRAEGRNLLTEKYGRMMKYTHPDYYEKNLSPSFPSVPDANYVIIDKIVSAMIQWEKSFAASYPKLAGASRPVTADNDAGGFTSMETYARGELATYPSELLELYEEYVDKLRSENQSLSIINQKIMVNLYGYSTIEDAEASL